MKYKFYTCDVFTDTRFAGNQLAVLPEADGLSTDQMQQIAREFDYFETTFVFPAGGINTRKVRIFTPKREVPFSGHPNIGTAFVLATNGEFGSIQNSVSVIFEEKAGLVPIRIDRRKGKSLWCELTAPQNLTLGKTTSPELVSSILLLKPEQIITTTHPPQEASVGSAYLFVEVENREALEQAYTRLELLESLITEGLVPEIHVYTHSSDEYDIRARMFAPLDVMREDTATGSANCALAGLLSHYSEIEDGQFNWHIAQGVELGRLGVLEARAEKKGGIVTDTWVSGACVLVSEGTITMD